MASQPKVLIAGGYGTFGRLLARALASSAFEVVIAGRDLRKAEHAARATDAKVQQLDLDDLKSVAAATAGSFAVVCTAGPFHTLDRRLPPTVADAGAHWLDTSDDPGWILDTLDLVTAQRAAIIPGLSSTPAITGVLARWCAERTPAPVRARVSLSIGNRNTKGAASIASVLSAGLRAPRKVAFPDGERTAYRFPSADRELLSRALGLDAEMCVALGFAPLTKVASVLGRPVRKLPARARAVAARSLSALARPLNLFGSSGGVVQAEVWDRSRKGLGAAMMSARQDLAIVPCLVALDLLARGEVPPGLHEPAQLLPADRWVEALSARGLRFYRRGTVAS